MRGIPSLKVCGFSEIWFSTGTGQFCRLIFAIQTVSTSSLCLGNNWRKFGCVFHAACYFPHGVFTLNDQQGLWQYSCGIDIRYYCIWIIDYLHVKLQTGLFLKSQVTCVAPESMPSQFPTVQHPTWFGLWLVLHMQPLFQITCAHAGTSTIMSTWSNTSKLNTQDCLPMYSLRFRIFCDALRLAFLRGNWNANPFFGTYAARIFILVFTLNTSLIALFCKNRNASNTLYDTCTDDFSAVSFSTVVVDDLRTARGNACNFAMCSLQNY